ncbi:MAG: FAD-binding oxidoreductase [Rhodobiaceae bacterium]|nr:FAD-binding oxidoreductase [Rhodobiaceae bacterium]
MTLTERDWSGFADAVDGVRQSREDSELRLKSRDFFWFSPILKPLLEDKRAEIVVTPADRGELRRIAAACARFRIPVTVRGGGTGNYGQAVPLDGGVVLDMAQINRVLSVEGGVLKAEGGARMLDIDREIAPTGWELRFHPSTRKQATLGGFLAGGAAGAGSCTWGQISDPGAVLAATVMTLEEEPREIELTGPDVLKVIHAYGINGIITDVTLPLAPAYPWAEMLVRFDTLVAAAGFAMTLMKQDAIAKKLVSVMAPPVMPYLKRPNAHMPAPGAGVVLMVHEAALGQVRPLIEGAGGTVAYERDATAARAAAFDGTGAMPPIYEYTWNHTTLHALRMEPEITYLQLRFPPDAVLEKVAWVEETFPDEVLLHLEFQRRFGAVTCSSLPLVRFTTPERLYAIIDTLNANDVLVSDPHTFEINKAGWKRVMVDQPGFKAVADPHGLMNPGKLGAEAG